MHDLETHKCMKLIQQLTKLCYGIEFSITYVWPMPQWRKWWVVKVSSFKRKNDHWITDQTYFRELSPEVALEKAISFAKDQQETIKEVYGSNWKEPTT